MHQGKKMCIFPWSEQGDGGVCGGVCPKLCILLSCWFSVFLILGK